jgi:putative sporulation protein YtxC
MDGVSGDHLAACRAVAAARGAGSGDAARPSPAIVSCVPWPRQYSIGTPPYTRIDFSEGVGQLELASVGAASHLDVIRGQLRRELADFSPNVSLRTLRRGRFEFIAVDWRPQELPGLLTVEECLQRIAGAVAESILIAFEPLMLDRTLTRHYGRFEPAERSAILAAARRNLAGGEGRAPSAPARRERLAGCLLDHLRGRRELVVEGFLAFRLRDYAGLVEDAVAQAVDDFLLEREYREFIRLLQYFVAVQPPKISLAHLVVDGEAFRLLDREGKPLEAAEGDCVAQTLEARINFEDLLLSALIAAAPRRIRLHGRPDGGAGLDTVSRVFEGRIDPCRHRPCPLCSRAGARLDGSQARRYTRA